MLSKANEALQAHRTRLEGVTYLSVLSAARTRLEIRNERRHAKRSEIGSVRPTNGKRTARRLIMRRQGWGGTYKKGAETPRKNKLEPAFQKRHERKCAPTAPTSLLSSHSNGRARRARVSP